MDTIGRVYDLVRERDMSLYALTQLSGVPYSTIRTAEARGGQLKVETIERLCAALGITLSEFFRESAPMEQ